MKRWLRQAVESIEERSQTQQRELETLRRENAVARDRLLEDNEQLFDVKLAEIGPVLDIFDEPLHPYTQLLIASLPLLEGKGVFKGIPGMTPSLLSRPPGCAFHTRCPQAMDRCSQEEPELREVRPGRFVSCLLFDS